MNRAAFYAAVRTNSSGLFGRSLSQRQVDGFEAILDAAERYGTLLQFLAYMLATAWHETAHTMQPIEEYGHGKGRKYGVPAGPYGHIYFGRGLVQLTWIYNYQRAAQAIGVDFVKFPEKTLETGNAVLIMFHGMEEGWFTGKKLADYIVNGKADYRNCRRIINGTDQAERIASCAAAIENALLIAGYSATPVLSVMPAQKPRDAQDVPPSPSPQSTPPPQPAPAPAGGAGILGAILNLIAKMIGGKQS